MNNYLENDENVENPNFYRDLISNDTMNTNERFDRECLEVIASCNDLDLEKNICGWYALKGHPKLEAFLDNMDIYTRNAHIVEWLSNLDFILFEDVLSEIKCGLFGNVESFKKEQFPKQNLPIFRIMKYCLRNNLFEKYRLCAKKLEREYVDLFTEIYQDEFKCIFAENKNNPDILYLFSNIKKEHVSELISQDFLPLLKKVSYDILYELISEDVLPRTFFMSSEFLERFKYLKLEEQIALTEIMENIEYPQDFIKKLHSKFNRENKTNCRIENILFEVSPKRLQLLYDTISNSSYFKKYGIENTEFWKLFTQINSHITEDTPLNGNISLDKSLYIELMNLYKACRDYATTSIVNSLYPLDTLKDKVTYFENMKFNILARVTTMFDCETLEETFEKRTFCGFSILNENNFSHFGNSALYGYYTSVTPDLIAHICPMDSLSTSWAMYEKDLSRKTNLLLDIDDLNNETYKLQTYNQLCVRTKTKKGKILYPNCIIYTNDTNESSIQKAEEEGFKVLVLKKNPNTIEFNDDPYKDYS